MLDADLTTRVLAHLGQPAARPSLRALNRLVRAYVRRVPWETAFRIVKRRDTPTTAACSRWPAELWEDALMRGGGGTCFESNYAFQALLSALGYESTLTINDMGTTHACHTALIVSIEGARYLVDIGLPLHAALRLDPATTTRAATPFHTYLARPDGASHYQIERTRHPQRIIYTLLATPVDDAAYRAALTQDYGACGLFLDKLVIVKVIDDAIWRFSSIERPYRLDVFARDGKRDIPLAAGAAAPMLAARFGMDEHVLAGALAIVE